MVDLEAIPSINLDSWSPKGISQTWDVTSNDSLSLRIPLVSSCTPLGRGLSGRRGEIGTHAYYRVTSWQIARKLENIFKAAAQRSGEPKFAKTETVRLSRAAVSAT